MHAHARTRTHTHTHAHTHTHTHTHPKTRAQKVFQIFKDICDTVFENKQVSAISCTIIPVLNTFLIFFIVLSMYSILGTRLFFELHPQRFGSFTSSALTMLQVLSLSLSLSYTHTLSHTHTPLHPPPYAHTHSLSLSYTHTSTHLNTHKRKHKRLHLCPCFHCSLNPKPLLLQPLF